MVPARAGRWEKKEEKIATAPLRSTCCTGRLGINIILCFISDVASRERKGETPRPRYARRGRIARESEWHTIGSASIVMQRLRPCAGIQRASQLVRLQCLCVYLRQTARTNRSQRTEFSWKRSVNQAHRRMHARTRGYNKIPVRKERVRWRYDIARRRK